MATRKKEPEEHLTKQTVRDFDDFFVLVPALNERSTIKSTIQLLLEDLKALPVKTTLVVIDDASDDGTGDILRSLNYRDLKIISRHLPDARKGKGLALDSALVWINLLNLSPNRTIVGVIDADSSPNPTVLKDIYHGFTHSHYDLVQTGIQIVHQKTFLLKMQSFEFQCANYLAQVIRTDWGSGIASGNGQFMTLKMTNEVQWGTSLLEDLQFSLKGLFKGYRGLFLSKTFMPQQGLTSYKALVRQRTRWSQGGFECLFQYGRKIWKSHNIPSILKTDLLVFMLIPFLALFISAESFLATATMLVLIFIHPGTTISVVLVLVVTSALITALMLKNAEKLQDKPIYNKKEELAITFGNLIYIWVLTPVLYLAFVWMLVGRNNWTKTAHD